MTSALTGSTNRNLPIPGPFGAAAEYATDAAQRWVLFLDVLRRGNAYREHAEETAPNVSIPMRAARRWPKAGSAGQLWAGPYRPAGKRRYRPTDRPFVVVDPRAGHGPGIGGFKADSEIGMAFKAGHPCYFIGFLPEPVTGQTMKT